MLLSCGYVGERTNTPAARFGTVSIMSPEPIINQSVGMLRIASS